MIGMEYLTNEHYTHLNVGDDISKWTTADMKVLQEDTAWTIKAIYNYCFQGFTIDCCYY